MFVFITTLMSIFIAAACMVLQGMAVYFTPPFSRRVLAYEHDESIPVINEQVRGSNLTVAYGGDPMVDPHVVRFKLSNTGKRDVPSSAFDQAMPLQFDFGAKIIAILHSSSRPTSLVSLKAVFSEQVLGIGPSLIPRGSLVEYVLLVDGPCGVIVCRNPLEEVRVGESRQAKDGSRFAGVSVKSLLTYACIAFVIWWLVQQPANAAHLIHNISSLLTAAALGLSNFVSSI